MTEKNTFYVYVLKSINHKRLYTGYTENLENRIKNHNAGRVKSSKAYCPYELVHKECYNSRTEARKRELFLKSGQGRKFLNIILAR